MCVVRIPDSVCTQYTVHIPKCRYTPIICCVNWIRRLIIFCTHQHNLSAFKSHLFSYFISSIRSGWVFIMQHAIQARIVPMNQAKNHFTAQQFAHTNRFWRFKRIDLFSILQFYLKRKENRRRLPISFSFQQIYMFPMLFVWRDGKKKFFLFVSWLKLFVWVWLENLWWWFFIIFAVLLEPAMFFFFALHQPDST